MLHYNYSLVKINNPIIIVLSYMTFRDNLKSEIAYHGLLLKELADLAQISKRTLDGYVDSRASMPPADVAVRLAKALNTTVEFLVTGSENNKNEKESNNLRNIRDLIDDLLSLPPTELQTMRTIIHAVAEKNRKQ